MPLPASSAETPSREFRFPIRVLSDFHLGHSGCVIDEVAQLRPLLEGAGTLVFNGDTLEQRADLFSEKSAEMVAELKQMCAGIGADTVFLTGNHDPSITGNHYLDLLDGRVFVTHGHCLFPMISPWSKKIHLSRAAIESIRAEYTPADLRDLDKRMELTERSCWKMSVFESELKRSFWARMWTLMAEMWPPHRPWAILTSWTTAHLRAFEILDQYRPDARLMLFGHTHFPGRWRRGDRMLLNTGGYLATLNARVIEIDENQIVHFGRVVRRNGQFTRPKRGKAVMDLKQSP